ncbi:unnamed protein product [Pleuronectes platessa]|uniref:Uncharacterized protein n=1 Tax=Pleuronectes platessa TaxID=8262 RepID=A0A9N7UFL7_PLEPL|nr:unnamed protein product [Pleuronectes platessa]
MQSLSCCHHPGALVAYVVTETVDLQVESGGEERWKNASESDCFKLIHLKDYANITTTDNRFPQNLGQDRSRYIQAWIWTKEWMLKSQPCNRFGRTPLLLTTELMRGLMSGCSCRPHTEEKVKGQRSLALWVYAALEESQMRTGGRDKIELDVYEAEKEIKARRRREKW